MGSNPTLSASEKPVNPTDSPVFIYLRIFIYFNIFSRQQKYISNLLSVKTFCIFLFPVQSRRQHFHLPKPHPVYQALQLDKRGAIHIYGGLQKRSGQTDFIYSFELVARKRYSIISLLDLWGRFETQNYIINYNGTAYTRDKAKDEIEAKQKIISKLSDDILDKLRDYLSSLDTLEDKVNG